MSNNLHGIFSQIEGDLAALKKPLVVGVNGAYTSGKTVFTEGLQTYLQTKGIKTQPIHYDDFHNPFATIQWTGDGEIDAYYNRAFDPDKLVREVLRPLNEQGYVDKEIACINLGTGDHTNILHLDIDEKTVVLLEGVLLFRAPLMDYLGYKIYLDISDNEILKRARQRDVPRFGEAIYDKFITRYIPVQRRYMDECNPREIADIVIDNNDYGAPKTVS